MKTTKQNLQYSVNSGALLKEILNNPGTGALVKPIQIFGNILAEVGERAAQLNDPELNVLMCRLSIYSIADQYSPDYDKKRVEQVYKEANKKPGIV